MPTVSVIIPTCNRVDSLKQAVDSALNQTYRDFEIVVVNDGSTDRTSEYLSALNNPLLRYCEFAENRGGSSARNEGINKARGSLVAFLDDDDCWEPSKLEEQVNAMNRENADLCYTGVFKRTFRGKIKRYIFMVPRFADLYKSIMANNFLGGTSSIIVKKELLEKIRGFDPLLPAMQDWDLFIRLLKNGCKIYGIDKPLVQYQVVDISRNISGSFHRYKTAEKYIRYKYRDSEFFPLLNRRMIFTEVTRHMKSFFFLLDSIKYYSGHLFKR